MITSYLQTDDGDLLLENGDFVRGDVRQDMVMDTMNYMPGDNKAAPEFGAGLRLAMGGKPGVMFTGRVKQQCKAQGIEIKKLITTHEGIEVQI